MKTIVTSDIYAQIKPKSLPVLRDLANSGNKYAPFAFKNLTSRGYGRLTSELTLPEPTVYAIDFLTFTNLEVFLILSKAIKIVENTEQYTEYLLNSTFGEPKFVINPPGTIRFYSQDLICFYNGKSWRKFDRRTIHV
jgi:hypothetical protein